VTGRHTVRAGGVSYWLGGDRARRGVHAAGGGMLWTPHEFAGLGFWNLRVMAQGIGHVSYGSGLRV
jgi:hypothetical protein